MRPSPAIVLALLAGAVVAALAQRPPARDEKAWLAAVRQHQPGTLDAALAPRCALPIADMPPAIAGAASRSLPETANGTPSDVAN